MNWLTLIPAILTLMLIGGTGKAKEPEARELAQKFLAHVSANAPIAGTFEILTTHDPAIQEALRKAEREKHTKGGLGVSFGPDNPLLNCRWAWDGSREMLDTLSGSNVWGTFLRTPEARLQGTIKDNFNLDKAGPSILVGPSSFYFLGASQSWSEALTGCKFRIEDAPAGAPPGCVTLAAKSSTIAVHLVVNKAKGTLHGYRVFLPDGKLYGELAIDKVQENPDGRVFPTSARLLLFQPATGKLMHTQSLAAREISFPSSRAELDNVFRLTLPKGTVINDFLLSTQMTLKNPALAADVLDGKLPGSPTEFKLSPPSTGTQTVPGSDSWYWWGLALLLSLPLAIYLAYRSYKIWKFRDAA